MLKIKDNVDLKGLEKFGFEVDEAKYGLCKITTMKNRRWYLDKETNKRVYDTFSNRIIVNKETRDIYILVCGIGTNCCELDVLYDLIQSGLVEKVKEE